jgi:nucleoside-diphosphate-sugar epimerase
MTMQRAAYIHDEDHLDDLLSEPSPGAIETLGRLEGDVVVLGVGGKMGPTLARMVRRASEAAGVKRRVIGVARFSQPSLVENLQQHGIETIRCDLLDPAQVERLPEAANVVAMTGMKFGSTGQEALTWAMNSHVPSLICRKYRQSRIVAFSTGNVYGMTPVRLGGALEGDALQPVGEYAQSTLGRERMYEYFSQVWQIPMVLLRLNYATEMRYGVLVDIARKVLEGEAIDVAMGHFNSLWQGDANAMSLCAFAHVASPAKVLNLAGPEVLSVRRLAEEFGRLLNKPVQIQGQEAEDALISNAQESHRLFGYPRIAVQQMVQWVADWVRRGGSNLGKPTHFEVRSGKY